MQNVHFPSFLISGSSLLVTSGASDALHLSLYSSGTLPPQSRHFELAWVDLGNFATKKGHILVSGRIQHWGTEALFSLDLHGLDITIITYIW